MSFTEEQLKSVADDSQKTNESVEPSCKSYINIQYVPNGTVVNQLVYTSSNGRFYKWNGSAWILLT